MTAKLKGKALIVLINLRFVVNKQFVSWRKFCWPDVYNLMRYYFFDTVNLFLYCLPFVDIPEFKNKQNYFVQTCTAKNNIDNHYL